MMNCLSQVAVSKLLGFSSSDRVSHWEKGTNIPSLINLLKLSCIYKTPIEVLYKEYAEKMYTEIHKHTLRK